MTPSSAMLEWMAWVSKVYASVGWYALPLDEVRAFRAAVDQADDDDGASLPSSFRADGDAMIATGWSALAGASRDGVAFPDGFGEGM